MSRHKKAVGAGNTGGKGEKGRGPKEFSTGNDTLFPPSRQSPNMSELDKHLATMHASIGDGPRYLAAFTAFLAEIEAGR